MLRVGVVVIDVQETFIKNAANENLSEILNNIQDLFQLSSRIKAPFFITYEGSQCDDMAAPQWLVQALPPAAKSFIKTTYAATGLPVFVEEIKQSALTHVILAGSETDVCVMQTALGLRRLGYGVILQKDAVFSSDDNVGPALRRMAQAGVQVAGKNEITEILTARKSLTAISSKMDVIIEPVENGRSNVGIVLDLPEDFELATVNDSFKEEKMARLAELLVMAEWLEFPVYFPEDCSTRHRLPSALLAKMKPAARVLFANKPWSPMSAIPTDGIRNLIVAGLSRTVRHITHDMHRERQIFLMEDALFSSLHAASLPACTEKIQPITYKSLYREITRSIFHNEWPSPRWKNRDAEFFPLMTIPEDLPRLISSPYLSM